MKIILKNKDLYKNLKGFISNKSLNKLIKKEKPFKVNPNKVFKFIIIFCGSLFLYHLYTLWKSNKNENNKKIRIVPLSGIY